MFKDYIVNYIVKKLKLLYIYNFLFKIKYF